MLAIEVGYIRLRWRRRRLHRCCLMLLAFLGFTVFERLDAMIAPDDSKVGLPDLVIFVAFVLVLVIACHVLAPYQSGGPRYRCRYANSPSKAGFESLHSGKGPCCSDADGTALSDVDWETKDGHYRVRIEGQWWDVPDEAVITETEPDCPNDGVAGLIIGRSGRPASGYPLLHAGQHDVALRFSPLPPRSGGEGSGWGVSPRVLPQ